MQRNSTYNKIKEIINTANVNPLEINAFSEILQSNQNSFIFYKNEGGQAIEAPCSIKSIKHNIKFCVDIGLLDNTDLCKLTEDGIKASNPINFDSTLRRLVLEFLEKNDILWDSIVKAINQIDYASPKRIYDYLSPQISEELLRKCLFLLSLCGLEKGENILHGFIKKTYLTKEKIEELWNA